MDVAVFKGAVKLSVKGTDDPYGNLFKMVREYSGRLAAGAAGKSTEEMEKEFDAALGEAAQTTPVDQLLKLCFTVLEEW